MAQIHLEPGVDGRELFCRRLCCPYDAIQRWLDALLCDT